MASIGEISATLTADNSGFISSMSNAAGAVSGLGSKAGALTSALGGLGAVAGGAVAAGLGVAASKAAGFERSIAEAAARTGEAQRAMGKFGRVAKEAALASEFSGKKAAGGLKFLAKSGFSVQESVEALPSIMQGATAAGMGVAEMGEIASNALRAFGRDASETGQIMDVLVKASTSANTSVQELGKGIADVGGIASSSGQSIEETVAQIATMQDVGISSTKASTALRGAMSKLQAPTSEAASTLSNLGVQVEDSQGSFVGMTEVIGQLEKAGAGATEMSKIFGQEAGPTLQTLLNQGSGAVESFTKKLENSEGTSERIAGLLGSTLVGEIKTLAGSLGTLATTIGQPLLPIIKALTGVLQGATAGLVKMGQVVSDVVSVFPEAVGLTKQDKEETKKLGEAAQSTGGKVKGLGDETAKAAEKTDRHRAAQDKLNRSLQDFRDLDIGDKRSAFSGLADRARVITKQLRKARDQESDARREFKREAGDSLGDTSALRISQSPKLQDLLGDIRNAEKKIEGLTNAQSKVEQKISESADAQTTLTDEEESSLKATRKENEILRAQNDKRIARLKHEKRMIKLKAKGLQQERFLAQKENSRIKLNKRIAEIKKEQQPSDEERAAQAAEEGAFATPGRAGIQDPTRGKVTTEEDLKQAQKSSKEMQDTDLALLEPDTDDTASSELAKQNDEADKLHDKQKKRLQTASKLASTLGRGATELASAAGASDELSKGINAAAGAAQGLTQLGTSLASGNIVGAIGGGISALTSIIGGIGGGSDDKAQRSELTDKSKKDLAELIAKQNDRLLGERLDQQRRTVQIDARGAVGVGQTEAQFARDMTELIEGEMRRRESGGGL